MPQYKVTDPQTNRTLTLTGDSPPTEGELNKIFAQMKGQGAGSTSQPETAPSESGGKRAPLFGFKPEDVIKTFQNLGEKLKAENEAIAKGGPKATSIATGPEAISVATQRALSFAPLGMNIQGAGKGALESLLGAFGLTKKITPEMEARAAAGKEAGVPLTPADIRQTKGTALLESAMGKNIASGGIVQAEKKAQMDSLNALKTKVQSYFGGDLDRLTAGAETQATVREAKTGWKQISDAAYEKVQNLMPKGTVVPTPTTDKIADEIANDLSQSRLARGDMLGVVDKLRARAGLFKKGEQAVEATETTEAKAGTPSKFVPFADTTWQGLNMDRKWLTSEITKAYKAGDNYKTMIYGKIKKAIDTDLAGFSEQAGGEIKHAFDTANLVYSQGANIFKNPKIARSVIDNADPQTIMDIFLKPNNVPNINLLKQAAGESGMKPLKQAWAERLFSKGEEQSFSPEKLVKAWDNYDHGTLKAFLSDREYAGMKQLVDVSRMTGTAEKIAGNPSGTAQVGGVLHTIARGIAHPILTTVELIGTNKFANLYFNNPKFRELMIRGVKPSATVNEVNTIAGRMLAVAGYKAVGKDVGTETKSQE
jgi:hypothetical protein